MNKDTLIVTLSDMHTGGVTALFPDRFARFPDESSHTPSSKQQKIYAHFKKCAESVAVARKNKRLIIVNNGDAIEGNHHNSQQIRPRAKLDQIDVHVELVNTFKKDVGYKRGDLLYYTKGTEIHSSDAENQIGKELGAVQDNNDLYAFEELRLDINGKRIWWTHHGPTAGKGPNKGNGFRNWLRNKFYDEVNEGTTPPHMIITGHTHDPYWQIFIARYKGEYFPVRGLICPSWQQKTRYAYKVAALDLNKIGLQYFTVTADGMIGDPVELLMK